MIDRSHQRCRLKGTVKGLISCLHESGGRLALFARWRHLCGGDLCSLCAS